MPNSVSYSPRPIADRAGSPRQCKYFNGRRPPSSTQVSLRLEGGRSGFRIESRMKLYELHLGADRRSRTFPTPTTRSNVNYKMQRSYNSTTLALAFMAELWDVAGVTGTAKSSPKFGCWGTSSRLGTRSSYLIQASAAVRSRCAHRATRWLISELDTADPPMPTSITLSTSEYRNINTERRYALEIPAFTLQMRHTVLDRPRADRRLLCFVYQFYMGEQRYR